MKIAWSVGHDPIHSGAFSEPLEEKEYDLARAVVSLGLIAIRALNLGWEVLDVSGVVDPEGKSAGAVLNEKISLINSWGADVAIESHFNSSSDPKASGCETLYFSLPVGKRFSVEGKALAELIQAKTLKSLNRAPLRVSRPILHVRDRGAKGMASIRRVYNGKETFPRYAFLMKTKMPAVIVEPLFISSPVDTVLLRKDRRREIHRLAVGVVMALMKWSAERPSLA